MIDDAILTWAATVQDLEQNTTCSVLRQSNDQTAEKRLISRVTRDHTLLGTRDQRPVTRDLVVEAENRREEKLIYQSGLILVEAEQEGSWFRCSFSVSLC